MRATRQPPLTRNRRLALTRMPLLRFWRSRTRHGPCVRPAKLLHVRGAAPPLSTARLCRARWCSTWAAARRARATQARTPPRRPSPPSCARRRTSPPAARARARCARAAAPAARTPARAPCACRGAVSGGLRQRAHTHGARGAPGAALGVRLRRLPAGRRAPSKPRSPCRDLPGACFRVVVRSVCAALDVWVCPVPRPCARRPTSQGHCRGPAIY